VIIPHPRRGTLLPLLAGLAVVATWLAPTMSRPSLGGDPPAAAEDAFAAAARRIDGSVVGILRAGTSCGAGFVWRGGGLVVTAAHVAAAAGEIRVRTADGREWAARPIGSDDVSDVALLRIDADPPPAPQAPADAVRRGDAVAAIGDPLGFSATLTVGHLSDPARRFGDTSPYDVLQHDAALNPGSSGGQLIDRDGRVLAMNLAIADGGRRHVGIGFALPIAVVDRIAARLLAEGEIARPHLGVRLREAAALRAAIPRLADGLVVEAVEPGSPATDLAPGAEILAADGIRLRSLVDLARLLDARRPGDTLRLTLADGERSVVLGRRPPPAAPPRTRGVTPFSPGFALDPDGRGRVAAVAPSGPAAAAGLAVGDEILSIGDRRLAGADGPKILAEAVRGGGAGGLALLVRRGGDTRWLVLGPQGRLDVDAPFGSNVEARTSHSF